MKKNISLLVLSVLLASCVTDTNVPIRSATQPAPYVATNYYDQSYDEADDSASYDVASVDREDVSNVVENKKTSMIDEVNSVDVNNTNYNAMGNYKIGNPYQIDGVSYYPHEDYSYSEIGIASWYGPKFHGGSTANGEVFDENKLTAAHRTLPMPSLVRVTNLENGVSVNVKVNDRGPYARDRIIDLSSSAAEILGIKEKGSARVKVEILPEESKKLKELAIASQNTDIYPANLAYSSFAIQKPEEAKPAVANAQPQSVVPVETKTEVAPVVAPVPVSTSAETTTNGDYFVQVAAYSTYEKAEALKDKLTSIGTVKIFKSVVNGNTLYKVRLGEYASKEQAEKAQDAVSKAGIQGSRVILKEAGAFKWNIK